VPIVMQMTAVDCGVACLAMVLRHHGRDVTLSECHRRAGVGRDGTTLRTLVRTARSYGLQVTALHVEPSGLGRLALPAIAHWEDAHYVVLEKLSEGRASIVDPAVGRRSLGGDELAEGLTGAVLELAPGADFEPSPRRRWRRLRAMRENLRPLIDPLRRARRTIAMVAAASVAIQALGLALPALTALVIDDVLPSARRDLLTIVGAGAILLIAAHFVTTRLRAILLIRLQARLDHDITTRVFEHLLALPFAFFTQRASGDLMERMTSTVLLREIVSTNAMTAVLDAGFMTVYIAVLLATDLTLGAVVLAVGFTQLALLLVLHGRARRLHQRQLRAQAQSQALLFEALEGIATVKATGAEQRLFDSWSRRFTDALAIGVRQKRLDTHLETATAAVRVLAPALVLWLGAQRVLDGSLSLGTMMALQALALAFLAPLGSLVANAQHVQAAGAHLERLRDILDAEPERPNQTARARRRLSGAIELVRVSFTYEGCPAPVLRDVSLSIAAGQKIAIVGRSGSGKTTLALLLLGLYAPSAGKILYDGVPDRELDRRELRAQFGAVLQESFIFGDSIRRNIAATDAELPLEAVVSAARIAEIHDEIAAMPMRYETRLAGGGGGLSGGQRQRISIARAVANDPAILLLDEGTSHLDVVTERRLNANLDRLRCTRIVIAHRLSTVVDADQILVVEDGMIAERGRHGELLARGGAYSALVCGQAAPEPRLALVGSVGVPSPENTAATRES
jgi:ATP-binding cassette, subfamily B, bacterial